jgi:hypothetical protein
MASNIVVVKRMIYEQLLSAAANSRITGDTGNPHPPHGPSSDGDPRGPGNSNPGNPHFNPGGK